MTASATTTTHHRLTRRADRRIRAVAITGALVVSIAACVLSFAGLRTLGEQSGLGMLSWLFPVAVDGLLIVGAMVVLRGNLLGISTGYGWFLTVLGVAASTAGNMLSSPEQSISALAVHSSFPVIYALTLEALLSIIRRDVMSAADEEAQRLEQEAAEAARQEKIRLDAEKQAAKEVAREAARAGTAPPARTPAEEPRQVRQEPRVEPSGVHVDADVQRVREVAAGLPEGMGDTALAEALIRAIPGLETTTVIASGVFGDVRKTSYNAMNRARKRIAAQEAEPERVALHAV